MQYLLMICGAEGVDVTPAEHQITPESDCVAWEDEMRRRGAYVSSAGLRASSEAMTVRVRNDEVLLADGPFAESKEQMGGFSLLECADLNEAVELAAMHPAAAIGSIEVRPVWQG